MMEGSIVLSVNEFFTNNDVIIFTNEVNTHTIYDET
ncbi:hypothetical protein JOC34_000804 [Virgibacillus halotolerans]|nr:hypothetical protein [Virgibacillus halotolerans]